MGSGNEKLNFSAEHREFLPQQIGAVSHAYLFRNASNQTPFVSSGFDAGNLPLFGFGKRLTIQSATATTIPARAFHRFANQSVRQITLGFFVSQCNHRFHGCHPAFLSLRAICSA